MTMQIWAFDRFDKADGTGKASMVLGTKHLMRDEKEPTIASWEDTPADCLQDVALWIDTILPDEISPHVKLVTAHSGEQGHDIVTQNKTLIPAAGELNIYHGIASCQAELPAFPIFTDNNSRIKKFANGTGETGEYFTRTVERPTMSGPEFVSVSELGDQWHVYQGFSAGVCFFFNI